MAVLQIDFFSNTLMKAVGLNVLWPETGTPPFPTFYLLHGFSDDYTAWLRFTRLETYSRGLPLAIVMPDGFQGFYVDNAMGLPYGRYMEEDVVNFVERTFAVRRERESRCVGGLSMGGYGALRLALGRPDLFGSANAHSAALRLWNRKSFPQDKLRYVFGDQPDGSDRDVFALASRAASSGALLPNLLLDCGVSDELLSDSQEFHQHLARLQVPHQYAEHPGGHNWDYWDRHIREALDFHCKNLGLRRATTPK